MPICECGFNYFKARLEGRDIESYAVIHDKDYRRVINKELAYRSEKDKEKKGKLLFNTSRWVGSLVHCPECGAWMLSLPEKRDKELDCVTLRPAVTNVTKGEK
jgi:hypothetical protein